VTAMRKRPHPRIAFEGQYLGVVIEVDGDKIGPCLLEAVESDERNGLDDMIVLRFQSLSDART
jgi:hypothetical protein